MANTHIGFLLLAAFVLATYGSPVPTSLERPAYVIKFAALFPGGGSMAFCDHNSTPRNRNKCDFRVHFDVLFQDDPDSIPYGKFEYDLPDHSDYYVAEPTATYWPSPLPNPSYPGTWKTLTKGEYERILEDAKENVPIQLRVTVFDRDDVGWNDMIAQQTYNYSLNDVLRNRERMLSQDVACTAEAKCQSLRLKFMFYMLDQ